MARMSSASAYTAFHQASSRTFDPYMPIVVIGALVGGVALAVVLSPGLHSASGQLAMTGVVGYVAVMAISLATNVPINKHVAQWSIQDPPADWSAVRARWIRFHILRTLVSLPALASYLLSSLLDGG
jgi:uncharacterized membrane protein